MPDRRPARRSRGRRSGSPTGSHRYPRTARVNQVLHEVVADELERIGEDDARLALITVTGLEVDPDLRHATVFVGSHTPDAADALSEARVRLQSAIARQVRMKRTPTLTFTPDPAVETATRIEEIIRGLPGPPDPEGPGPSDPEGDPS